MRLRRSISQRWCCVVVLSSIGAFVAPGRSYAAPPETKIVLKAPLPLKVLGKFLDLHELGSDALRAAGCQVVASEAGAFEAVVEASVTEKAPAICAYSVKVVDEKGGAVYAVPRTVEDAICSLPWMKGELQRHLKVACDIATGIVTRQMLNAAPAPVHDTPAPAVEVVVPPPPPVERSHAKAYVGWGLVAGGAVVALLGAQLWAADGDSLGPDRIANTSGGPVTVGLGIAMALAGGLMVGGQF